MTETREEITPCAHCGAQIEVSGIWLLHPDNDCILSGYEFGDATKDEGDAAVWAITAWNTRPAPEPVGDMLNDCIREIGGDAFVAERDNEGLWSVRTLEAWRLLREPVGDDVVERAIHAVAQLEMDREGHPYSRTQEEIYKDAQETVEVVLSAIPSPLIKQDCPSCGGLNLSCPDGCGRDPKTGELNGTRLVVQDALRTELAALKQDSDAIRPESRLDHITSALLLMAERVESEGDQAYFGSTNDADQLLEIAQEMDAMRWEALERSGGNYGDQTVQSSEGRL